MSDKFLKIFLLCPYVSLNTINKEKFNDLFYKSKSQKFSYTESSECDINYLFTLENHKKSNFYIHKTFKETSGDFFQNKPKEITNLKRTSRLICDENYNFLVIFCYEISLSQDCNFEDILLFALKNRQISSNLEDNDFDKILQNAKENIQELFIKNESITLDNDTFFPLVISNVKSPNLSTIFKNEETKNQREKEYNIVKDYENSFYHIGWNYAVVSNFPQNVNENIFLLLAHMQINYYSFMEYKKFFNFVFSDIHHDIKFNVNKNSIFNKNRIKYYDFKSKYQIYKNSLFPKYHELLEDIEQTWHICDDLEMINETFSIQSEFVNKLVANRQNTILNIIALLQILSFISIILDASEILEKSQIFFYLSLTFTSLTFIIFLLLMFVPTKEKYGKF